MGRWLVTEGMFDNAILRAHLPYPRPPTKQQFESVLKEINKIEFWGLCQG